MSMTSSYKISPYAGMLLTKKYNLFPAVTVDFRDFTESPVLLGGLTLATTVTTALLCSLLF